MYDTDYENGVLVCNIHRTPISKSHGRFFCVKCQRSQDTGTNKMSHWQEYRETLKETNELLWQACKNTKRISTVQFAKSRYKDGILTKERYINILKKEAKQE